MSGHSTRSYLASLQVFRGLAALGVVFYHAGLFSRRMFETKFCADVFRFGELGVDFFFVLSGFIITMIHWKEAGQPERAPRYLKRRFFRVYPLLFVVTTLKISLTLAGLGGSRDELDAPRIISSYLMIPPPDGAFPVVTAAWTLSHEALFYGVFLVVLLMRPAIGKWVLSSWAALILVIHSAGVPVRGLAGFVVDNHNIEFLIGVGVCLAMSNRCPSTKTLVTLGVATILALAVGAIAFDPLTGHEQTLAVRLLIGLGCAGIIAVSVTLERRRSHSHFPRMLCWLGDASYSIYLGHSMVLLTVMHLLGSRVSPSFLGVHLIALTAITFALAATALLWRFIEKPILDWSKQWTR